eukprot:Skav215978  [mRNA]  locus=scaffold1856:52137:64338:- [translate_table: standard]
MLVDLSEHILDMRLDRVASHLNLGSSCLKPFDESQGSALGLLQLQGPGQHQNEEHLHEVLDALDGFFLVAKAIEHEEKVVNILIFLAGLCARATLQINGRDHRGFVVLLVKQLQEALQLVDRFGVEGPLSDGTLCANERHWLPIHLSGLRLTAIIEGHRELNELIPLPTFANLALVQVDISLVQLIRLVARDEAITVL